MYKVTCALTQAAIWACKLTWPDHDDDDGDGDDDADDDDDDDDDDDNDDDDGNDDDDDDDDDGDDDDGDDDGGDDNDNDDDGDGDDDDRKLSMPARLSLDQRSSEPTVLEAKMHTKRPGTVAPNTKQITFSNRDGSFFSSVKFSSNGLVRSRSRSLRTVS